MGATNRINMNIKATEEDASPETRFVRRVEAGSVPLPNEKWLRSPKLKDYAICLDLESLYSCCLMLEGWHDNWVRVRAMTIAELVELRDDHAKACSPLHLAAIETMIDAAYRYLAQEQARGL
jgi:hypothetical protein